MNFQALDGLSYVEHPERTGRPDGRIGVPGGVASACRRPHDHDFGSW